MRVFPPRRPPSTGRRARASGFTLVELAITVLVLAVMIGMSAPLFTGMINGNRLTSNANELVAALQIARMESIRRNVRTTICQSADQLTCSNVSPWRGWIIFADADNDGVVDAGEIVRTGVIEAPVQVIPSGAINANRIVFRADGMPYGNGNTLLQANLRVCLPTTNPRLNARNVNIAIGGRVAVRPPTDESGACNAPADT
ncbi:MAG: GspH/FimT family pseudopilin [Pseudomonadota bacterium]